MPTNIGEFLGFLAVVFATVVPILAANRRKLLSRRDYAIRSSIAVATLIAAMLFYHYGLVYFFGDSPLSAALTVILLAIYFACTILLTLWSVHRVQHIGWSKWCCLLFMFPLGGLIFLVILTIQPGRTVTMQANTVEAPSE